MTASPDRSSARSPNVGEPVSAFAALADPNRRRIIELLSASGPATATTLAGELAISRQAAAKHLALLADAGLAVSERSGRETRFQAQPSGLSEVSAWVRGVESDWTHRLQALAEPLTDDDL